MKVSRTGRIVAAALGLLIAGRAAPVAAEPAGGPPAAPAAEPQAPTGDPVQSVRTLQLLQDRVAAGSRAAHESQPLLIARINADLLAAPPEIGAAGAISGPRSRSPSAAAVLPSCAG